MCLLLECIVKPLQPYNLSAQSALVLTRFAMPPAGYGHAIARPLDVFGLQVSFPRQVLLVLICTMIHLLCPASHFLLTTLLKPGYADSAQAMFERSNMMQEVLPWTLPPVIPRIVLPTLVDHCVRCQNLVLYVVCQNVVNLLVLYAVYLLEWRDRRLFVWKHAPEVRQQQVASATGTALARVLLDGEFGWEAAVLLHANVILLLMRLAWFAAPVMVEAMALLLPTSLFDSICPA